jgi:hypothetical protein
MTYILDEVIHKQKLRANCTQFYLYYYVSSTSFFLLLQMSIGESLLSLDANAVKENLFTEAVHSFALLQKGWMSLAGCGR